MTLEFTLLTTIVLEENGELLFSFASAALLAVHLQAHLGLNEINETAVLDFLKFFKEKRTQSLKSVETVFSEVAESRLVDETFTSKCLSPPPS